MYDKRSLMLSLLSVILFLFLGILLYGIPFINTYTFLTIIISFIILYSLSYFYWDIKYLIVFGFLAGFIGRLIPIILTSRFSYIIMSIGTGFNFFIFTIIIYYIIEKLNLY